MPNTIDKISTWIFSFITTSYAIYMLFAKEFFLSLQALLVTLILFVITYKYKSIFKSYILAFHTNVFIFTAAFLGLVLNFYRKFNYFDLAMHLYAGILLVFYGFLIYSKLKGRFVKLNNTILLYILIFFFSVTILLIWECLEYVLDVITLSDHMNSRKTGVSDTMTDLLIGMAGSIITLYYHHRNKMRRKD